MYVPPKNNTQIDWGDSTSLIVLVGASDDDVLVKEATAMTVVRVGVANDDHLIDGPFASHEYLSRTVCGVAFSSEGLEEIVSLGQRLSELHNGIDLPLIDLSTAAGEEVPPKEVLLKELTSILLKKVELLSKRNVDLMRSNSQLRNEYDELQRSFSQLEKATADRQLSERSLAVSLNAAGKALSTSLSNGDVLVQRLPGDSAGISDVAIQLESDKAEDGVLDISLETIENGQIHACWRIDAVDLTSDWVRLSLPRGMGADRLTAQLRIVWHGQGQLTVRGALQHPDARFVSSLNDEPQAAVIALRIWSSIPHLASPPIAGSHLPTGEHARREVIAGERLGDALCLNEIDDFFGFMEEYGGLRIHPFVDGVSAGLFKEIVSAGANAVRAIVKSVHPEGPRTEYAIGIADSGARLNTLDKLPQFLAGQCTEWIAVESGDSADIVLPIEDTFDSPRDLYLMTRLAKEETTADCAWATYSRIELIYESDAML